MALETVASLEILSIPREGGEAHARYDKGIMTREGEEEEDRRC